jgi:hypothetical protein
MKPFLILAVLFIVASSVFAVGPQTLGSFHAESAYDHADIAVTVLVGPVQQGMMWMNANHSYPLLFSERDKLAKLIQTAAKKIDIAISNKTTISYAQEIGGFYTENGALVTVFFDTDGYELSYAVVRVMGQGNSDILLLNKKDTEDFISLLRNANNLADDYLRQVALFR